MTSTTICAPLPRRWGCIGKVTIFAPWGAACGGRANIAASAPSGCGLPSPGGSIIQQFSALSEPAGRSLPPRRPAHFDRRAFHRPRPKHNFSISLNQWIAAPEIVSVSIVGLRPQVAARRAPRALYQAEQLYNYFGSFEPAAADYNSSMIFRLYQSRAGRSLPQRRPASSMQSPQAATPGSGKQLRPGCRRQKTGSAS